MSTQIQKFPRQELVDGCKMTDRDSNILEVLTHRLRLMSCDQIARTWWDGRLHPARNRLRELDRRNLIELTPILAQRLPAPTIPIVHWHPGDPRPDFGNASYRLRSRWTEHLCRTIVASATTNAAARFGGWGGRRSRASESSHDLQLASVFLHLRQATPKRARGWLGEAALYDQGYGRGDKLPDAMIVTRGERTVIECGGAYRKEKLEEFHASCAKRDLSYEIW